MIVFAVVGLLGIIFNLLFQETICLFQRVIGIPCLACGMTRAYLALLDFDIISAFWYHPLFWMPILICVLAFFDRLNNRIVIACIILIILVWIIRMIFLFPNQIPPMVLDERGIVPIIFNRLRAW